MSGNVIVGGDTVTFNFPAGVTTVLPFSTIIKGTGLQLSVVHRFALRVTKRMSSYLVPIQQALIRFLVQPH